MNRIIALALLLVVSLGVAAESPEQKGLRIAQEADQKDNGWKDQKAFLVMILRNQRGDEDRREIRTSALEVPGDGDKSLMIFDAPGDVKGTAFLSYTHALKLDDQWLYLPALKRVKRIASRNQSGPFMGSEFAYEDMTSQEVEKYTYRWLRDEVLGGRDTWVVERTPVYPHSGYKRQIVWLDKKMYQPLTVEYYDTNNKLLKTMQAHGYKPYESKPFWRPARLDMVNHQTGKETTMLFSDYQFETGLSSRDFDRNSLKGAR